MTIEEQFIKNVNQLIPRPEIALDVMTIANESDCDIPILSNTIQQDPSLTANMLKLANSAYFGHMKEINSITDIIVRLGLDTVKMIAITSASIGLLKTPHQAYNLEPGTLYRHSYATALLSSIIGRWAKCDTLAPLYSSALLHDIGKIILNRPLQVEYMNRGEDTDNFKHISELENFLLHTNHAKVGMVLLKKWGLPDLICDPVGFHHDLKGCNKNMNCKIVYLANYLTESIGIQATDPENYFYKVEEELNASDENLPDIPEFKSNMEKIIIEFFEKFNDTNNLELQ